MTTTPPCPEPSYGCRLYTFQHHAESTICFTHHPARLLPVSLAFHLQCRRCRSIPGSGRSPGEGIGYPLQYSLASLVAQLVKNLPAMWETWVHSLGWEDLLEKGKATHSSILENSMDCIVHGVAKSQTQLSDFHFHLHSQTCPGLDLFHGHPTLEAIGDLTPPYPLLSPLA